jgi:ketosteroid isomerase-like protein
MDGDAELIETAFARLNEHDLAGYYELFAEEVVYQNAFGTFEGKEASIGMIDASFATVTDHWRRIEKLLVCDGAVAVWLTFGATNARTRRSFAFDACTVFHVRDGRIGAVEEYADWTPAREAAR